MFNGRTYYEVQTIINLLLRENYSLDTKNLFLYLLKIYEEVVSHHSLLQQTITQYQELKSISYFTNNLEDFLIFFFFMFNAFYFNYTINEISKPI